MVKVTNVPIRELIILLHTLAEKYDLMDMLVYPDEKKVIIEPIEKEGLELTDENIYDLI